MKKEKFTSELLNIVSKFQKDMVDIVNRFEEPVDENYKEKLRNKIAAQVNVFGGINYIDKLTEWILNAMPDDTYDNYNGKMFKEQLKENLLK